MKILNPAIKGYMKLRNSAIDNFVIHPYETQTKVFNSLLANAQYTEFGKQHNFNKINTVKEFKAAVPVCDYETLKPYVNKILEGEQQILWNSDITWFAKSSGTTSDKSKFIPVSKEALDNCHFKAGMDVLALYYRNFPSSSLLTGKGLALGGSHQINQLNAESFYGDLSAVMLQNMSSIGNYLSSLDLNIALMSEWEEKIEKMARYSINSNITFLAGVPTWTIVLIKKIFEITGKNNLLDVWPDLELYIHGGVSFTPYRPQFNKLIPSPQMHYIETYNASEGFFAAQDDLNEEGMLLFLNHGIYYEFMPIEEQGQDFPRTLTLQEVELGKQYAIVINTNAGLWRYIVGDTVVFTSLTPFRIKVSGRLKFFMNAFGEEIIVDNSDQAIAEACLQTGAIVNDYTAAPIFFSDNESGAHEWIFEFDKAPSDLNIFTEILDAELKKINSDYEAKRHKSIALRMPILRVMPAGGFNAWLKSKGKLGGQHKVPRLSNDRKIIDEILDWAKAEKMF
jgi:GH3 auxin-responsive promoter